MKRKILADFQICISVPLKFLLEFIEQPILEEPFDKKVAP